MNSEQFAARLEAGAYALDWQAHGLSYGLPASLIEDLKAERTVIVNGSRAAVAEARRRFPQTRVILVDASTDVRAARLAGRGRETAAEVAARLAREVPDALPGAIRVDNSGALADGIAAFLTALRAIAAD